MDHVLDAVFAWLDGASLLRAGAVCRRWADRASRPEAWHGRMAETGWTRGMPPRCAWLRSLGVRARWRRSSVAVSRLTHDDGSLLCGDGDWVVYDRASEPFARLGTTHIHDLASGQTVGVLRCRVQMAALSCKRARVAAVNYDWFTSARAVTLWAPAAPDDYRSGNTDDDHNSDGDAHSGDGDDCGGGGGDWRQVGALPGVPECMDNARLLWQGDGLLLAYGTTDSRNLVAEWIDPHGPAMRVACRCRYDGGAHGGRGYRPVLQVGAAALVASAEAVYVLDPRDPSAGAAPLMRLGGTDRRPGSMRTPGEALDDGRHIVTYRGRCVNSRDGGMELWDVRAARADARPVAELHEPDWRRVVCATARGTVLGWRLYLCAGHAAAAANPFFARGPGHRCDGCRMTLREWDPAGGAADDLFSVGLPSVDDRFRWYCSWGDERRMVVRDANLELYLFDTAASSSASTTTAAAHGPSVVGAARIPVVPD